MRGLGYERQKGQFGPNNVQSEVHIDTTLKFLYVVVYHHVTAAPTPNVGTALICMFISISKPVHAQATIPPHECSFSSADQIWAQHIIDGWVQVTQDFLGIPPEPLPWTVFFDSTCTWHISPVDTSAIGMLAVKSSLTILGKPILIYGLPHDDLIQLPNGTQIPVNIIAVAFPFQKGENAFFVLALPDLWKKHPQASKDPYLEIRIQSVALHEMIHTRQLPALKKRVDTLRQKYDLPDRFDDDILENTFRGDTTYVSLFKNELSLLYTAIQADNDSLRNSLIKQAFSVIQKRQNIYFTGSYASYMELEGLFLNMEGVAEWIRFKYHQADSSWPNTDEDILDFMRGQNNSWSQDEGLALILLLDEIDPDWKTYVLGEQMKSPLNLLHDKIIDSVDQ